jgi:HAD superfamily hydrolase (TIGR01509 family)
MVQAVVFDIGGVLAHDVWEHLLLDPNRGIAAVFELNTDEVRQLGRELWDVFAHRAADHENTWEQLEIEYWSAFIERSQVPLTVGECILRTDEFITAIDGMQPLLLELRSREIAMAICSNNTEFWFRRQMDKLGLAEFFKERNIILSSRLGVSKSSPNFEMFHAVVASLKIDKEDCVLIDDRAKTIARAINFGMPAIMFPSESDRGAGYLRALFKTMSIL